MANIINELLQTAPRTQNPAVALGLAQRALSSGLQQAQGIAQAAENKLRNKAINRVLATEADGDPEAYQDALTERLTKIGGMDPVLALNLATAKAKPLYEARRRQDELAKQQALQDYRNKALAVQELGLGTKTATQPKTGEVRRFNPETGQYEPLMKGIDLSQGNGGINPKNVELKAVTVTDGKGNKYTEYVPVDKLSGKDIRTGKPVRVVQRPKITQQDKDAQMATDKSLKLIDDIKKQYTSDIVGPFDKFAGWVANTTGTAKEGGDTERQAKLNATIQNLKANLTAALIKGAPSDKDMAVIEGMLPDVGDSEAVFKAKLQRIEQILKGQKQQAQKSYYDKTDQNIGQDIKATSKSGRPMIKRNGRWYYAD